MTGWMVALLTKPTMMAAQYWLAMMRRTAFSELLLAASPFDKAVPMKFDAYTMQTHMHLCTISLRRCAQSLVAVYGSYWQTRRINAESAQ